MNFRKPLFPLIVALGFFSNAFAVEGQRPQAQGRPDARQAEAVRNDLNDRDWSAVDQYLENRQEQQKTEQKKKNSPSLEVSGDVRTEWRYLSEREDHLRLRPRRTLSLAEAINHSVIPVERRTKFPVGKNDFDIEVNLKFEFTAEKTWAFAQIQFDNAMGVEDNEISDFYDPQGYHGSGTQDSLDLKRAYWGYNLYEKGCDRIDLEVGRRRLYDIFDSKIQFGSRFDGALIKFLSCIGDTKCYLFGAGIVVDEKVNHFAYATEVGFLDIQNSGFDLKYSFIHWNKFGHNRYYGRRSIFSAFQDGQNTVILPAESNRVTEYYFNNPRGFRFQNSQFTAIFHLESLSCWKSRFKFNGLIYGGVVYNHAASKIKYLSSEVVGGNPANVLYTLNTHKKQPWAFYVGFTLGKVKKEGDLSFDVQYQWVGANAIPDDDIAGIGRGNYFGESFTCNGRGATNYRGWRFEALYAITDDLTIDSILEFSNALNPKIGGPHHYSKFELEAIYAF